MKTMRIATGLLAVAGLLLVPGNLLAADGLAGFLDEIEIRASKDMGSFRADLTLNFDVSDRTVDGLFQVMSKPSDVYMCLRVGEVAKLPIDRVVEEYKASGGQGWGAIAKNLGIKPGSAEFHALKQGRLSSGGNGSAGKAGKGKKK